MRIETVIDENGLEFELENELFDEEVDLDENDCAKCRKRCSETIEVAGKKFCQYCALSCYYSCIECGEAFIFKNFGNNYQKAKKATWKAKLDHEKKHSGYCVKCSSGCATIFFNDSNDGWCEECAIKYRFYSCKECKVKFPLNNYGKPLFDNYKEVVKKAYKAFSEHSCRQRENTNSEKPVNPPCLNCQKDITDGRSGFCSDRCQRQWTNTSNNHQEEKKKK